MKEQQPDNRMVKVWTTEGPIRFTLLYALSKVLKFRGVYSPLREVIK